MQEQLATLESQLQDKEQLIAALTERLEQAAEQLDRLKRNGADRALRTGGGFPPELIEEQKELVEELQRAVQQWEDMQPGVLLGRIEMQLGELRDLVSGQGSTLLSGSERGGYSDRSTSSSRNGEREKRTEKTESKASGSGSSAYEALKAGLLANDLAVEETSEEAENESQSSTPAASLPVPTGPEYEESPLDDPPPAIDLEHASAEELRKAVEERDTYIMYVLGRLRNAESRHHVPNNWKVLETMPEALQTRLDVLEKQLQQTLRTAEVELSLHRAKLGREEARLRLLDEQVQKKLQRAGISEEQAAHPESKAERDSSPSSRWLRMIGRHKEQQ